MQSEGSAFTFCCLAFSKELSVVSMRLIKICNVIIGVTGFSVSAIGTESTGIGGAALGIIAIVGEIWYVRPHFKLVCHFLTTVFSLNLLIKENITQDEMDI